MHYLQSLFQIKKITLYHSLNVLCIVMMMAGGVDVSRAFVSSQPVLAATYTPLAGCPGASSTRPTSASLLIVLLDRSGSIGIGTGGTDPENYSASVTNALSDLWPGPMAVIAFPSSTGDTLLIGPSLPGERTALKDQVNSLPSQGETPLEAAMKAAQSLLKQRGVPQGSRIVLITDGMPQTAADPDGTTQESDISKNLAPQFCQENVSVSPFGLTIPENSAPARFLQQIATDTNGTYKHISNNTELAGAVLGVYAQWDGLEFNQITRDQAHDYYPVVTDSSVQSAYILTFYQAGQNEPLTNTLGQKASSTISSDGRHYEIDTLNTPIPPATYTVRTSDPQAVVYTLDRSTRILQLVQPTAGTLVQPGQTITIVAHLLDQGKGPHVPAPNEAIFFRATIAETLRGHTFSPATVDFSQKQAGSDLFTGKFAVPADTIIEKQGGALGTLLITVSAFDQGVTHTTNPLTIQLTVPKYVPPPPPSCKGNPWQCSSPAVHGLVMSVAALLVLLLLSLLLSLWWHSIPAVFGTIYNIPKPRRGKTRPDPEDAVEVHLGSKRTLYKRLFSRSVITSDEITRHPDAKSELHFDLARFELVARRGKPVEDEEAPGKKGWMMYIRPAAGNIIPLKVKTGNRILPVTNEIPLASNSTIIVNEQPKASYA